MYLECHYHLKLEPIILAAVTRNTSELDTFLTLFPKELFEHIANCTNQRLEILRSKKVNRANVKDTVTYEMMILLGCTLIMSYNKLPSMHMYWSTKKSMGNAAIREAISRDRFQLLFSKLYFNDLDKPDSATKTFYMEKLLTRLKGTFMASRSDSTFHCIDEAMTKFKADRLEAIHANETCKAWHQALDKV